MRSYLDLLDRTDAELALVDPLVMNLFVAKGLPALANLDIRPFQQQADSWAGDFRRWFSRVECEFDKTPEDWGNDMHKFRLGMMCQFLDQRLGIAYKESHRGLKKVDYTDPNDLFLTGVMTTRRGVCGTMAELHLALGWRMCWPVTLTKIWWHCMLRFDNGEVVWNLETTDTGRGGFCCHSDEYLIERDKIDRAHIRSGSDLNTLTPRQVLGAFIGSRGRHFYDTRLAKEARKEFELALTLYPQSRVYQHMLGQCDIAEGLGFVVTRACLVNQVITSGK